jgi:hypothetical protein
MHCNRPSLARFASALLASMCLAIPIVSFADGDATGQPPDASATAPGAAGGAPTAAQLAALAKEAQNPVGNIAIVPFQNNFNYSAGPNLLPLYNLNIQPVIPIMLSPKMNLIERAIVPIINQPSSLPPAECPAQFASQFGCGSQLGIGSIQLQSFFAPKTAPNALIYGYGPILQFPTVTKNFGSNQVGAGVNVVGLVMPGPWVIGLLANQLWGVAGPSTSGTQSLNTFLTQPFINYNLKKGWAISEAPSITANWSAPGNQKWTVPIGLAVINTNTWFKLPMSFQLGYYGNIVRPVNAPYGQIRFQWALIWPVKRGG